MCHLFSYVTRLIHMCDMTHSYVWHDSFIRDMTHSREPAGGSPVATCFHIWHDSFICVKWLIHVCDMTHSCVRHECFIREMPYSYWIELILPQLPAFIHVSMSYVCVTCVWRHTTRGVTWPIYIEWSIFSPAPPAFIHVRVSHVCVTCVCHMCVTSHLCMSHVTHMNQTFIVEIRQIYMTAMHNIYIYICTHTRMACSVCACIHAFICVIMQSCHVYLSCHT